MKVYEILIIERICNGISWNGPFIGLLSIVAVKNPALSFSCECDFSWEFPAYLRRKALIAIVPGF